MFIIYCIPRSEPKLLYLLYSSLILDKIIQYYCKTLDILSQLYVAIIVTLLTMLKLLSKETIENQALQMELDEADTVQYGDSQLVEQLRSKVCATYGLHLLIFQKYSTR